MNPSSISAVDPLTAFQRLRQDGFNVLLHSQTGEDWSYLIRTGAAVAELPPTVQAAQANGGTAASRAQHAWPARLRALHCHPKLITPAPPPFRSGWIVIATYDHGLSFEEIPLPDRSIMKIPPVLSLRAEEIRAIPPTGPESSRIIVRHADFAIGSWSVNASDDEFMGMVKAAKEYIAAGDIYQVNLARCFEADFAGDPFALFARLAKRNPSPYACYLELPDLAEPTVIVSSSPELLFRTEGRRIVTRPIAGTYSRDRDPASLPRDPKERAEHIMLVDLERNDLGRIARPGSVMVEELLGVETYSHLHHIVSQVAAEMRDDVALDAIMRAFFPGGTITGAPKIRAMQIISELERSRRGLYTGAIGFVDDSGNTTMNIVIRTAVIQKSRIMLAAGAGIVADSIPEREAAETRIKAESFLSISG